MNQEQRRYAIARVDKVKTAKLQDAKDKHSKKEPRTLNQSQKLKQIRDGFAQLRSSATLDTPLGECFYFEYEGEKTTVDEVAYNKARIAIEREAGQVKDAIMFKGEEEAKEKLLKFCEGY